MKAPFVSLSLRHALLNTTACFLVVAAAPCASYAAPDGAQIIGGSAAVVQSGNSTVITQQTDRSIIRWNSFDVGSAEAVRFQQPSSQSITINRISDTKESRIDGHVSANGRLIMINPNGIVFGDTARVDVAALHATSTDIGNDTGFLNGDNPQFTKAGRDDAKIINHGHITAKDAGLIGLVAPAVENSGLIAARLGKIHLAGGDVHTLDLAGDGLIQIEIPEGQLPPSIKNSGTLQADDGVILMTAAEGRAAVDSLITHSGIIQAAGGDVTLTADNIALTGQARVSVADKNGGGKIRIGGDKQGQGSLPKAKKVHVGTDVIMDASATEQGHGGDVILWANEYMHYAGQIMSRGAGLGGNGGFTEVSGKDRLDFKGRVDLSAPFGSHGTLLLDPTDIVISAAPNQNVTGASPFEPNIDDGPSVLNVTTLQTALGLANVIVQTRATGSQAGNITVNAPITWAAANTLTLDAHNNIVVNNAISGRNITFIAGGDVQIGAALTGIGTLSFSSKNAAGTMGLGTGQAGILSLTNAEIANITNGWANLVFGRTDGTGAINVGALTWNDALTFQSLSAPIIINGVQTLGANNVTFTSDGDPQINAAMNSTGTLFFQGLSNATTFGVGTGQSGTVSLNNTDLGNIDNTWGNITIGRSTHTGTINAGSFTLADPLTLRTDTGLISINNAISMGNNALTIQSNANPLINANLTGTGNLNFITTSAGTSIGIGTGQAGTFSFDDAELVRIVNGWGAIVFGQTTGTGVVTLGSNLTWNDPVFLRTTNTVTINGVQSFANNNLTIQTNSNPNLLGTVAGTGTFTLQQIANGISMGIGTGQVGTVHMDDAELARILNGWGGLVFGLNTTTQPLNIGAYAWNDSVTFRSGTGLLSVNGIQNLGANNLTITSNSNIAINSDLNGTGTLTIAPSGNTSMGIGTGQAGTVALTDAELARIINGWGSIVLGSTTSTAAINIGTYNWNDNLTLRSGSGLMTIAGNQTMGANNLALQTDSNLALNANLSGTGILTIRGSANATTRSIGTGQVGTLNLNDTELTRITNGWTRIDVGHTGATGTLNVGASNWNDTLRLLTNTGVITINGDMNLSTNSLSILTNANPAFNADMTGTGTFTLQPATNSTTIGIGTGQVGTIQLTDIELARIATGWDSIILGSSTMTGVMNIGPYSWQRNVIFRTNTGIISVNGAQNGNARNMTFETDANLAINAAMQGSGILTIRGAGNGTTMGIGTGQAGTLALSDAELNFLSDGWNELIFSHSASTGAKNMGARTWADNVRVVTNTGVISINGDQTFGANNFTLEANSNPVFNANLSGTGHMVIRGAAVGTTIGLGGGAGTLNLTSAEIARILDGWASVTIGRHDMTANIAMGAATWQNPTTFLTGGNISVSGIQTSTETSGDALVFVTHAGNFSNTAGAGGINPGGGRYIIYGSSVGATALGGLTPVNTINAQTYFSLPPASVAAGNSVIYSAGAAKIIYLKIDDKTKAYGDALPLFTFTYLGGLQGGDTLGAALTSVLLSAAGTAPTDNAGTTWAITGAFTTALGYSVDVTNGVLTVVKSPILVQLGAATRTYGAVDPAYAINYIGLKNGETSAVFDTAAIVNSTATITSNVGAYVINTAGANDNNYFFNYTSNTLTITKATLTATATDITRYYGDANPALTFTYSGFLNGDTAAVIDTLPTLSTVANALTPVSVVPILAAGGLDNNYNIILANGNLTVAPAPLVIKINTISRIYNQPNPPLTYQIVSGLRNGDTDAVLVGFTLSTPATQISPIGIYPINSAGGVAANYYISGIIPGKFFVTTEFGTLGYLPDTVHYTNQLTAYKNWNAWRDIIMYDKFSGHMIENILVGPDVMSRPYRHYRNRTQRF